MLTVEWKRQERRVSIFQRAGDHALVLSTGVRELRNALQVDGNAPEVECLLVVATRSQGVIKAHGELDRRLVPDRLLHPDHVVDVLDDGISLSLRVTGVEDHALHMVRTKLEQSGRDSPEISWT